MLRRILRYLYLEVSEKFPGCGETILSTQFFLRFVNPFIVSPDLDALTPIEVTISKEKDKTVCACACLRVRACVCQITDTEASSQWTQCNIHILPCHQRVCVCALRLPGTSETHARTHTPTQTKQR